MMTNRGFGPTPDGIKIAHKALSTSDDPINPRPYCIYVNSAGDATLEDEAGNAIEYHLVAGQILPFSPVKFTAGDAGLVGWY